jgi:hypothetical protein
MIQRGVHMVIGGPPIELSSACMELSSALSVHHPPSGYAYR